MQWNDEAIILSSLKYGESSLIVRVLTKEHGAHTGLVRGIRKNNALCQTGNFVDITWSARLEEHLGSFKMEMKKPYSSLVLCERLKLSALTSACSLIEKSTAERDPHPEIFSSLKDFLEIMCGDEDWIKSYILLELELLGRLGYGLDLSQCADTGKKDALLYVSPKSGRAVSEQSGEPYKAKLLKLPGFLRPQEDKTSNLTADNITEIIDGIRLTRYFLDKHVFRPQNDKMPVARERFVQTLQETY